MMREILNRKDYGECDIFQFTQHMLIDIAKLCCRCEHKRTRRGKRRERCRAVTGSTGNGYIRMHRHDSRIANSHASCTGPFAPSSSKLHERSLICASYLSASLIRSCLKNTTRRKMMVAFAYLHIKHLATPSPPFEEIAMGKI